MKVTGGCHCGHVTFTAVVDPETSRICHCNACQKLSGSPFRVTVSARAVDLEWTGGEMAEYVRTADSGRRRRQFFCPRCGSQIAVTGEGEASNVWGLRWGSIDQRADLPPVRQIWRDAGHEFAQDISALPARPRD